MTEPDSTFGDEWDDDFAFNFDRWLPEKKRGKVLIAEPSTDQVREFFTEWTIQTNKANNWKRVEAPEGRDETDEEQEARLVENVKLSMDAAAEVSAIHSQLLSDVCSGDPSVEDLGALPHRPRRGFEGYVIGKLSPQA